MKKKRSVKNINVKIPDVFYPLTRKSRYKVAVGGRGGGKSWTVATFFILLSIKTKIRVLCSREIMKSIAESVKKLLEDTISRLELDDFFYITKTSIQCITNESEFIFIGLKSNIRSLKSYEGVDYVWIEEAENVTKETLDILIPTIRKTKTVSYESFEDIDQFLKENPEIDYPEYVDREKLEVYLPPEIWILFNPNYEDDEVYQRFIVNTPKSCILIEAYYYDNEYFPPALELERKQDLLDDKEKHDHIWLGKLKGVGSKIYAGKFDESIHVNKTWSKDELFTYLGQNGLCYMAMDPHSVYYPAIVWGALILNEHGEYERIIYEEFPSYEYFGGYYCDYRKLKKLELSLKELSEVIYSYEGNEYGIQVIARYVDTRYSKGAGGPNVSTNTAGMIETWKRPENGSLYLVTPPEKIIDAQRQNILTDLSINKLLPISPFNKPKVTFAPWCRNVIHTMKHHRLGKDDKGEDEKYKDHSDALRIFYAGTIKKKPIQEKKTVHRKRRPGSWMA